jgi:hypothetical protein
LKRRRWLVLAALVSLLAVASLATAVAQAQSNGCIFDDGKAYCEMASGGLANAPFARRVVVPAAVSALPADLSVTSRFQLIALLAAGAAMIGTALLTRRLLRDRTSDGVAWAASLAAGGMVALSPHVYRLALTEPVLVDQVSVALGLAWCLLVTARRERIAWLSPLVILVLIPTREAWVIPLLAATGVLLWGGRRRLAAATLGATVVAAAFTLTRPTGPGRYDAVLEVLHNGRVALTHPDESAWAALFGVGVVSALALLLLADWRSLRGPVGIVFAVALAHLVQSFVAGADASRLASAALPFAIVLAFVAAADDEERRFPGLAVLIAATLWVWRPFDVASTGVTGYTEMYYPPGDSALIALASLALIAGVLVSARRRGASRIPA